MSDMIIAEPLYEKLKKKLLEHIETERPRLLPCEKELIRQYKVSRNTVRRAIQELADEGIVKPAQGLGTIVYPSPEMVENSMILVLCDFNLYPFQQEVFNQLMRALDEYRLNAMLTMVDKEKPDVARLEFLVKKADGVIIDQLTSFSTKIHDIIKTYRRKCVCLRWVPANFRENHVAEDVAHGFYKIARHLIELGHREIAYLGQAQDPLRCPGIDKALAERSLQIPDERKVHFVNGTRYSGFTAADELLRRNVAFTAVICHNDDAALGVMEQFFLAGMKIPQDVSITGFDNVHDSEFYPVPLTTCGASMANMVNEAISILIGNGAKEEPCEKSIEPELIIRRSTDVPR